MVDVMLYRSRPEENIYARYLRSIYGFKQLIAMDLEYKLGELSSKNQICYVPAIWFHELK